MIHVKGLSKSFHQKEILKDLSFSIKRGEVIAIIGPSGSGKSTLIRCLNLLEIPDAGFLTIDDQSISYPNIKHSASKLKVRQIRGKTGMVFQSFNLFPHFTALKNIVIGLTTSQNYARKEAEEIAKTYLAQVGLSGYENQYPNQLSGGQQQRVAIARSLSLEPDVLLLDEPTSALDPELVHEVLAVIQQIAQAQKTLLIVTHELAFAKEVADRIMFIDRGEIVVFADTEAFFEKTDHPRIQQFLSKLSWSNQDSLP